jgi:DNA-binding MarR family transcriptional regulator/GNAT superfamily N-acetyltransferase
MPATPSAADPRIEAVREFNRFYTRRIGVLQESLLETKFSLTESRLLWEFAHRERVTATELARDLGLDPGYLSRLLRNFEKRGLISRKTAPEDGRQSHLTLTSRGRKMFAPMEQRSQEQAAAMLNKLEDAQQGRVVAAMNTIETLLTTSPASKPEAKRYTLRNPRHGDFGWIVSRHAELYAQEYGWAEPFEGLCAQIVADFVNNFDPKLERCWIADIDGENVGCVMLVKDEQPAVARVRLLLVDPKARGLGLGNRLVEECVSFARSRGYTKITLWTHSVLSAARHVYEKAGFTLTSSEPRRSWGQDVVAEFWDMDL